MLRTEEFVINEKRERGERHDRRGYDGGRGEPVETLSTIKNVFETPKAKGDAEQTRVIDRRVFGVDFFYLGLKCAVEKIGRDAAGNVEEEDPSPTPVIAEPASEDRAERGSQDDDHGVEGEGGGDAFAREDIGEDCLGCRLQTAAA